MSVQGEIDRIQSGVDDIKAAITEKGGTVADGAKVDQLGAAVRALPTGGLTEEEADARYIPITGRTYDISESFQLAFKGLNGETGASVMGTMGALTLSAGGEQILLFSNINGEVGMTTSVPEKWRTALGITGTGADGKDGADGKAATIRVGTVTTGAPGTQAAVVNSGTENAAVLDFTIPRGYDGSSTGSGGLNANDIYPVNSIKMWYDNEDHSAFLGFTWVRCLQNRFPAGIGGEAEFASIGQTGGEKTHALTTSEAPPIDSGNYLITGGTRERWIDGYTGAAGQPHNNLPPYEVVSFWRRTA